MKTLRCALLAPLILLGSVSAPAFAQDPKPDQTPLQFVERMYAAKAQGLDSLAKMFPETVKFYIGFVT